MARAIEEEIVREKPLLEEKLPEELSENERKLQIKTWIERSRDFLHENEFDQALSAAEHVFQLDSGNLEASSLVDEIKQKARSQGHEESTFLQELYQQEIQTRIRRYRQEAHEKLAARQWGAARLTIEKILLLNPRDAEGRRLLQSLEKSEGITRPAGSEGTPSGK